MRNKISVSLVAVLTLLTGFVASPALAADSPALDSQKAADQSELDGVEGDIGSIGARLQQIDQDTKAADAKRADAADQIKGLQAEADALLPTLTAKTAEYKHKQDLLLDAIRLDYHRHDTSGLELLAQGGSVSETLNQASYMSAIKSGLETRAKEAQHAFDDLHDQKSMLDGKRSTVEMLTRQLALLTQSMDQQKTEQQELLANKSNEASYLSDRIKHADEVQTSLLKGGNALWGTYSNGATVHQGDVIGFEGSTGNSTGCHTHFSVIESGQWVDPQAYLDQGVFRRPEGSVTQGFGMTAWARTGAYGGHIHNGVDFVQPCGSAVHAAMDGVVIRDNRTDGSGFGHYLMIRHPNGLITLYGHLI